MKFDIDKSVLKNHIAYEQVQNQKKRKATDKLLGELISGGMSRSEFSKQMHELYNK